MTGRIARFSVLAVILALLASWGCSRGPSRVYPPGIDSAAGTKAMQQYDTNGDGKVAGDELAKAPSLRTAIKQLDKNGDGAVTADEIDARIRQWKDSKLGRMTFTCMVSLDGQPLAGATVKFVPEKFLGDKVATAAGVTSADGMASITIPTTGAGDPPGVAPGLYRVEITKEGVNIPARYNTETTLGQEIALDAEGIQEGVRFNLQSQ